MVERAPELCPDGQAVDARGVAKEVIGRLGLDAAVRAACTATAGAHTVDADGQVLETFRADDDGGDGFIADIEILRGDLSWARRRAEPRFRQRMVHGSGRARDQRRRAARLRRGAGSGAPAGPPITSSAKP